MSILLDEMGLDEMSINQSDGCCSTLAQNLQPCTEGTWDKHHQHTTIKHAQSSCQNTLVFSRAATSVVYQKLPPSSSEKKITLARYLRMRKYFCTFEPFRTCLQTWYSKPRSIFGKEIQWEQGKGRDLCQESTKNALNPVISVNQ